MQHPSRSLHNGQSTADDWDPEDLRLAQLVDQARQGSTAAFEELYARTAHRLLAEVRSLVREDLVEDVLAETFLQAWRTLAFYDRGHAPPAAWLGTIARSVALEHLPREQDGRLQSTAEEGKLARHSLSQDRLSDA